MQLNLNEPKIPEELSPKHKVVFTYVAYIIKFVTWTIITVLAVIYMSSKVAKDWKSTDKREYYKVEDEIEIIQENADG